jgi:hypothetical protein
MALTLGRKGLPLAQKLSANLTVMLTQKQKKQLEKEAAEAGFRSLAQYVREERLGLKE